MLPSHKDRAREAYIEEALSGTEGDGSGGIYPANLKLELSGEGCELPYMDIYIYHTRKGWGTRIYDKRLERKLRTCHS